MRVGCDRAITTKNLVCNVAGSVEQVKFSVQRTMPWEAERGEHRTERLTSWRQCLRGAEHHVFRVCQLAEGIADQGRRGCLIRRSPLGIGSIQAIVLTQVVRSTASDSELY